MFYSSDCKVSKENKNNSPPHLLAVPHYNLRDIGNYADLTLLEIMNKRDRVYYNHQIDNFQERFPDYEVTEDYYRFHMNVIQRLIYQVKDLNSISRQYRYDPNASRKAGLPSYSEYLQNSSDQ